MKNTLSFDEFPSVMPMPEEARAAASTKATKGASARASKRGEAASARKSSGATSRWSKSSGDAGIKSSGVPTSFTGARCIVFMVGGLSYPELRVAREVMNNENREIVVGTTAFISPKQYMEDLETLGNEEDAE